MTELLTALAGLTDQHDRDAVDAALAELMFQQMQMRGLRLWRVKEDKSGALLHCAASLGMEQGGRIALDDAPEAFRNAAHGKGDQGFAADFHVFPVHDGRKLSALVELMLPCALNARLRAEILAVLRIYANHLSMVNYSDRDELTSLLNRRTFNETFERIATRLSGFAAEGQTPQRRRVETSVHVAVIDIDFFKRINDNFGHPYGDEVLVLMARLIEESFRDCDRAFRFGGEEFVVLLPDTSLTDAEMALERFRQAVEAFHFSQVGKVTISIGFAAIRPGDTGAAAFGRADQALYEAKHRGRNQVQCHELLNAEGALAAAPQAQEVELF